MSFEKIEIEIQNIEDIEKINKMISGIEIPIVINISKIPEDYVLENIDEIDENLKKHHKTKITYKISQCLTDNEAHFEDNSYNGKGKIYLFRKKLWRKARVRDICCDDEGKLIYKQKTP